MKLIIWSESIAATVAMDSWKLISKHLSHINKIITTVFWVVWISTVNIWIVMWL